MSQAHEAQGDMAVPPRYLPMETEVVFAKMRANEFCFIL